MTKDILSSLIADLMGEDDDDFGVDIGRRRRVLRRRMRAAAKPIVCAKCGAPRSGTVCEYCRAVY